jgi:hypothetical protein
MNADVLNTSQHVVFGHCMKKLRILKKTVLGCVQNQPLGSHVQPSTYVHLEGNNLVTVKTRCKLFTVGFLDHVLLSTCQQQQKLTRLPITYTEGHFTHEPRAVTMKL